MIFRVTSFLILIATILFFSCSSKNSESASAFSQVSISEVVESHPLVDDLKLLGNAGAAEYLGNNRWIIADNAPSIALFEDYTMTTTYGSEGEGPCEYQGISATDVKGDTLFVLSAGQNKIISFDISSGECIEEVSNEALSSTGYLHRNENNSFLVGRMSYIMMTPDSLPVVQILHEGGSLEPLDLTIGKMNPVGTVVSFQIPGNDFYRSGDKLYNYFPLTDSLYTINTSNFEINSFPLQIDIKREEFESAGQDVNQIMDIIQGDFNFVTKVIASPKWIAIQYSKNAANENDEPTPYLQFYTPEGDFIGETAGFPQQNPVGVVNGQLVFAVQSMDPNADYSYSLEFRDVILE